MATENKTRRNEWFAVGAFSVIALVSMTSEMEEDFSDWKDEHKWSGVSLIIAMGVAGLAFFAHALGKLFVGTIIEGFLSLVVFAILAGGLSTIMDPDNEIAQSTGGGIANNNLYFFSWAAFIASLQVFTKFMRDVRGIGSAESFSSMGWTGVAASSLVVMAAATRIYKAEGCDDDESTFCDRTEFAFSLGAICGLFGIVWGVVGGWLPGIVDAVFGVAMLAAWCFGVGYITFGGEKAPAGEQLGNLYFATWGSFIMSTKLAGDGVGKVFGMFMGEEKQEETEEKQEEQPQEVPPKDDEKGGDEEEAGDGDSA